MGASCTCNAEQEASELDVQSAVALRQSVGLNPASSENAEDFQFDIGKDGILGCSSIGTVLKTRRRGSKTVRAVKRISKRNIEGSDWKEEALQKLDAEVNALQKLDHPHICKIHEKIEDLMSVYLVMELCQGGNLTDVSGNVERFNESTVAVLVRQMASAVAHLHQQDLVHSDIRPENWLFDTPVRAQSSVLDMTLKMIDFGLANKHGRGRPGSRRGSQRSNAGSAASSSAGSPASLPVRFVDNGSSLKEAKQRMYGDLRDQRGLCCLAPEQLGPDTDAKADVWAIGVLSYFLLSGQSPFDPAAGVTSLDNHLSFRNARFVFMPSEIWRPVSPEAKNFIALCLQKDPENRPRAIDMMDLPWMRLAQAAIDDEHVLRSPGRPASPFSKLSLLDPPLATAEAILGSIARMKQSQILEKAATIAAARSLHADQLPAFQLTLESLDTRAEGVLPFPDLLRGLTSMDVPCADFMELSEETRSNAEHIVIHEFIANIDEFQHNMQDSAICSIFRTFEGEKKGVKRKMIAERILQASLAPTIVDAFPQVSLEKGAQELNREGGEPIEFEHLKQILRQARNLRRN